MRTIHSVVLPSLIALAAATGCGATAVPDRASTPQHLWTEGDWYAEAVERAHASYQAEIALALEQSYGSRAEAAAVARTLGAEGHFRAHLSQSLAQFGLTERGLRLYAEHHPEFVTQQEAVNGPRMEHARELASAIFHAPVEATAEVAFDVADEASGTQLAAR